MKSKGSLGASPNDGNDNAGILKTKHENPGHEEKGSNRWNTEELKRYANSNYIKAIQYAIVGTPSFVTSSFIQ